jgi:endonuclease III related protein
MRKKLLDIYATLHHHFGFQHWWPGETPFEVMVGAILTQNTAWSNVEKAIDNLKRTRLLEPAAMAEAGADVLAGLIRPSGYFNQKARKLKEFLKFFHENFCGEMKNMRRLPLPRLRDTLLRVHGIGRETADSILLYAAGKKIFVIDAYTRRILSRLGLLDAQDMDYDEVRMFFEKNLPRQLRLYKDFHAQLVMLGKHFCRKSGPNCGGCPVRKMCRHGKEIKNSK